MRARCAQCQTIFPVEGAGTQTCPKCGARLDLALPASPSVEQPRQQPEQPSRDPFAPPAFGQGVRFEQPPPGVNPENDPAFFLPQTTSQKTPTPWERRAELGFFKGLIDTIVFSLKSPTRFFEDMPTDTAKGAISFYWLVAGLGMILASLWTALFAIMSGGASEQMAEINQLQSLLDQMSPTMSDAPGALGMMGPLLSMTLALASPEGMLVWQIICAVVGAPLYLLFTAGLIHVSALLIGKAHGGFSATLRACGYGCAPLLFNFVPMCGSAIGGIAYAVFLIIGLSKLHRVSYGSAVLAYCLPFVLTCLCGCGAMVFLGGMGSVLAAG
ncbi:MAG: YIP1 family protein [Myxococcaceae bacterium]|nr:YIP1 family protein [Myxococcaceae bacterium]